MWKNDVTPPALAPIRRGSRPGRPLIAGARARPQSGIDPFSLVIAYNQCWSARRRRPALRACPVPAARGCSPKSSSRGRPRGHRRVRQPGSEERRDIGTTPCRTRRSAASAPRRERTGGLRGSFPSAGASQASCDCGVTATSTGGRLGGALLRRPLADQTSRKAPGSLYVADWRRRGGDGAPRAPGNRARPAGTELHRRPRRSRVPLPARRGPHRRLERHRGGIARRLARDGWHCVLIARSESG